MIYKPGDKAWSLEDNQIKEHVIQDIKFLTWIQLLKIDDKWQAADIFFPTLQKAMESQERCVFRMGR